MSKPVRAVATIQINSAGGDGSAWSITVDEGSGAQSIASYTESGTETAESVALALSSGFVNGYTTQNVSGDSFEVVAPVGSGSSANGYTLDISNNGTGSGTASSFTGGTD